MNGELFAKLKGNISVKDFRNYICSTVYGAMTALEWRGVAIDPVMVINQLRSIGKQASKSSGDYIADEYIYQLANESPRTDNFEEYVEELIATRGLEFERSNPKDEVHE
jgi:replicative DNA helicase